MSDEKPTEETRELLIDRLRHAIVFAEATLRALQEALALVEAKS